MATGPRPSNPRSVTVGHVPTTPSALRQSFTPFSPSSPDPTASRSPCDDDGNDDDGASRGGPSTLSRSISVAEPTETTALLRGALDLREHAHEGPCNHGTFSPRPTSPSQSVEGSLLDDGNSTAGESLASSSPPPILDGVLAAIGGSRGPRRSWAARIKSKKMSRSSALAERHGVKDDAVMYLSYYIPCIVWLREYKWSFLKGDFIAALTVAGMYLPMSLSLADNVAHVPAISGLYAFVWSPLVYAILGSAPEMVVGPEAAGSLLVGTVVKTSIDRGRGDDDDGVVQAKICGVVTGMAGATVLVAGLARLGFLDSVLSRPFLRGFISAIGFVIFVDQLIPELGLAQLAADTPGIGHGSSVDKVKFIINNLGQAHSLTCAIAGASFVIIMMCRELKRRLQPHYPSIAYVPDRLLVVVLSAILAWRFEWDKKGVEILGTVQAASGHVFTFRWPFQLSHMPHIRDALSTSFLIALLGFFESSVAAKSLGGNEAFPSIQLSANRELVALGAANFVGGCFMSLPAFGGYGRSKVNKSTGGKTPMSSVFLSAITVISILFILPYFYFLPKPVLCAMISVVAWSLIEEAPHDISFFFRIRSWPELGLMFIIVIATIFYSLDLGIAIGIGLSLLLVIRHSTRPRIQILGRIPGTHRFENAEVHPENLEFIEGCLIVKIPEPLTFANTGELKTRLRRLELYGTIQVHPALPRLRREDSNRNVIFDVHGVTSMDGSGTQVLKEIVESYRARGVRVFFSRGPGRGHPVRTLMERSGIVALVGGDEYFVNDVQEALKMTEIQEGGELGVVARETGRTMAD